MRKIAFFEIEDWEGEYLKTKLLGQSLSLSEMPLTGKNLASAAETEILSTFIYSLLSRQILQKLPSLKLIATRSTGVDHIDLAFCREKNITVCHVPVYGENTVAEHAFSLILALSRKLIPSVEKTRRGDFSLDGLRGFELFGKTLGVVGVGNIGKVVIRIAQGFGLNVLANSHRPDHNLAKALGFSFVDLPTLLANSDIVSLHLPYTKETDHFINKENILKFKPGSILINTSRGGLIETEAILLGLEKGILAGVGLDVLEEEVALKEERELLTKDFLKKHDLRTQLLNHVLLTKENVVITPHNAFNSWEALRKILEVTVENITKFLAGQTQNTV